MEPAQEKPFPTESVPNDAHVFTLNDKEYDVYKLIDYANGLETVQLELATLREQVFGEKCWDGTNSITFSPKDLLDCYVSLGSWEAVRSTHPEWSEHIDKTTRAEYRFPILMYNGAIIDGMHRLIRAITEKAPTIPAKILNTLPDKTLCTHI
ncbi:MAG: hypothetical protein RLZZ347_147 [Candidatus Parcubacteria bacterium]|jgi:hypothetical protein